MVYSDYKVYGPYKRRDGRQHVVLIKDDKRITVSCPKYLVEKNLGKQIKENETVHHIDGDIDNNDLSNLAVLDRVEHVKLDAARLQRKEWYEFTCPECGKHAIKEAKDVRGNRKKGKAGPFCDRSCAGKYGKKKQMGLI